MIGSGSGAKCHVRINKHTHIYMDIYVCMYVCMCVCVCVVSCFTSRFQAQLRLPKRCCNCSSTFIPSSGSGTAKVWKLLKVHLSIIDFRVTPLSLGPHPARTSTQTQTFMSTYHPSPSKADSTSERSIIKTLSPELF